jgi:dTDP-4-dehydrorhamnose reductase
MKLLIYGSRGWIGSQFIGLCLKEKENGLCFCQGNARVNNMDELKKEIELVGPTHIVSFIGRTHGSIGNQTYTTIDYLEQKGKLVDNIRDNLYSPLSLAILCKEQKIHYTYLGTGCIFKFDQEHPFGEEQNGFDESSMPNFFGSSYSIVKGFTDQLMHEFENVLNVRIRMPIVNYHHPRNFITKITSYEKICSIPNSMTYLPNLLPCLLRMIKESRIGTINLTNPGLISHNEILDLYKKYVDQSFEWKNFSMEEQNQILASERSNNYLNTDKLQEWMKGVLPIKEALIQCFENWHNK